MLFRSTNPAAQELARVRSIHATRNLVKAAELVDVLADVVTLAAQGHQDARQVLQRLGALPQDITAALGGLQVVRDPQDGRRV